MCIRDRHGSPLTIHILAENLLNHIQAQKIQYRAFNMQPRQDMSLNSDAFPAGSVEQRTNDERIVTLIREHFRAGATHLRKSFR